ncbi:repressor of RNA polymerase III transcription MAF1, partial [Jimgerdemannia flammicorona]
SAGTDKKLYKQLENKYILDFSHSFVSPDNHFSHVGSPLGPMDQPSSRKTLFYLIGTLNATFPDYDFRYHPDLSPAPTKYITSQVKPEQFQKQPSCSLVVNSINTTLFNLNNERIVSELHVWDIIDKIIEMSDCNVYSYNPDPEDDPNSEEGSIWSLHYFFFNRKLKRIIYFSLRSFSPNAPVQEDEDVESFSESEGDGSSKGVTYEDYLMDNMESI